MEGLVQAQVQQAIEGQVLAAAQQMEDALDEKLHELENLDEDDLERVKQRRLDEMKKRHQQVQRWRADGHGEYREIHGEKDFFKEAKAVDRVGAHFYRENWPCKVMDKHLAILAEKLKVFMLPPLALVKKGKVVDYLVGFDDLGG